VTACSFCGKPVLAGYTCYCRTREGAEREIEKHRNAITMYERELREIKNREQGAGSREQGAGSR